MAEGTSGWPQSPNLGPLLFLIFTNDIPVNFKFNMKILADDFSLSSLVRDSNEILTKLDWDLGRVAGWAYQWKASFNPDPSKQTLEIHFSPNINYPDTPFVYINNLAVRSCLTHKHLSLLLDKRLAFDRHVDEMILRAYKDTGVFMLRRYLPRHSLLTIYKGFIRPHLDYGDVVNGYPGNALFYAKAWICSIKCLLGNNWPFWWYI